MKNREWLNSMDNKTFAAWCCRGEVVTDRTKSCEIKLADGTTDKYFVYVADEPTPKLKTIIYNHSDSFNGLLEWLDKERGEE